LSIPWEGEGKKGGEREKGQETLILSMGKGISKGDITSSSDLEGEEKGKIGRTQLFSVVPHISPDFPSWLISALRREMKKRRGRKSYMRLRQTGGGTGRLAREKERGGEGEPCTCYQHFATREPLDFNISGRGGGKKREEKC